MRKVSLGFFALLAAIAGSSGWAAAKSKTAASEWLVPPRKARLPNPIAADAISIAQGQKLYNRECVDCHGTLGHGDGKKAHALDVEVADFSSPGISSQSDGALFYKINVGKKPMPSYSALLSDQEKWRVVNYLRALMSKPGSEPRKPKPLDARLGK